MTNARFTHIIFDLDGTLLNTIEDLARACNHTCDALGWPTFPLDSYRYKVGNGMAKLIERIMPAELCGDERAFTQAFAMFRAYYDEHKEDHTAPYPGMIEVLDALRSAGTTLAVLTNKDHDAALPLVEGYFGTRFALVQGATPAFPPKPAPAVTNHALELLSANPQTTLYVGDSDVDVQTGHNAGLRVAGAAWGFRGAEELAAAGAEFIVDAPNDLLNLVGI